MGRADYLEPGDWNAMCSRCGHKFKASMLRRHWQGMMRCPRCWEPRQPQDFVKAMPDVQTPPWVQPWPADRFTGGAVTLASSATSVTPDITDSSGTTSWIITIPDGVLIGTLTLEALPAGGEVTINVFGGLERVLSPYGTSYTVQVFSGGALLPATVSSITPSSATALIGDTETYTVNLTGARSYDATVTLTSSDPTIATVPASVSITTGLSSATFAATAVAPGTVTLTATLNGTATASFVVEPKVVSLTPTPTTVAIGGTRTMTVTLDAAPAVDTVVALSSSNSGIVSVPASVTVLQGATTATFSATGVAGGSATLTATLNGTASASISAAYTLVIAADTTNYNVYVEFTNLYGDPPPSDAVVQVTINAGIIVSQLGALTSPFRLAGFGLTWSGTPAFTLINKGYVIGSGGNGGKGAEPGTGLPGVAGSAGSSAMELDGYAITIDNSLGYIWGGGGGGGGGGEGGGRDVDFRYGRTGGAGGGAGAGTATGGVGSGGGSGDGTWTIDPSDHNGANTSGALPGQIGGLGGPVSHINSLAHPTTTATGGTSGNGGDYGQAGGAGGSGSTENCTDVTITAGGAGGAAGKAISLSGGTATFSSGSTSPHVKGAVA